MALASGVATVTVRRFELQFIQFGFAVCDNARHLPQRSVASTPLCQSHLIFSSGVVLLGDVSSPKQ